MKKNTKDKKRQKRQNKRKLRARNSVKRDGARTVHGDTENELHCVDCGEPAPGAIQKMAAEDTESSHGWKCGCKGMREFNTWSTIKREPARSAVVRGRERW